MVAVPVFLDANVYFVGFSFPNGTSSVLFDLARQERIVIFATRSVLREADLNLRKHAPPPAHLKFQSFLKETKVNVLPGDPPLLEAALQAKAACLFTLDRKRLLNEQVLPPGARLEILTPRKWMG